MTVLLEEDSVPDRLGLCRRSFLRGSARDRPESEMGRATVRDIAAFLDAVGVTP